jgi:serine/threonine protein kinase
MAKLQQGDVFDDRYRLLRKLGVGCYSEVWLAEDTLANLEYVLRIFVEVDRDMFFHFQKEFERVRNINHPNILKYTYFNLSTEIPYLIMPYYIEGSAEGLIDRCTEQEGWMFLHDVASGLACLHSQDPAFVHRNIKPENVLRSGNHFIITDYLNCYSFVNSADREIRRNTQGTRPYCAPEIFQLTTQPNPKSDIWSLAAVLFELLSGRLMLASMAYMSQLKEDLCRKLPTTISNEMRDVIEKCLSLDPRHRPTAEELVSYVERVGQQ